jgi:hypothetical protein
MGKIQAFFADEHVHSRICQLLWLAVWLAPAADQKYVLAVAFALTIGGFVLPKWLQSKVDAMTGTVDK